MNIDSAGNGESQQIAAVSITVNREHGSIPRGLRWEGVPPLAVVTGKNGAGKSQLLEVIAARYGALRPNYAQATAGLLSPLEPTDERNPSVTLNGAAFEAGEVFHSYGAWHLNESGGATSDQVKQAILEFTNPPLRSPDGRTAKYHWADIALAESIGSQSLGGPPPTPEVVERHVTPELLWGRGLPAGPKSLAFLFLAYQMLENTARLNNETAEQIETKYGPAPWIVLDEILTAASLPYRVVVPERARTVSMFTPEAYALGFRDMQHGTVFPIDMLSSGEKVIMTTALWLYGARAVGKHFKLLLLDEPDAHLHPSMTRRFLDVIQRVFVEERGVRVLMTTHSPSTVALVPEASLFEMTRHSEPRIRHVQSRQSAIAELSDGLVIAHEGMQVVLCEGTSDVPFYQMVWEQLTDVQGPHLEEMLPRAPSLVFMNGKGVDTVRELVPQLRQRGLLHFHGLIDLDKDNKGGDGIHVLKRTALENYLLDPLNVWCFLHNSAPDKLPPIPGVSIPRGMGPRIAALPEEQLQMIADSMLASIGKHLLDVTADERKTETVRFVGGKCVRYPRWFLYRHKNALTQALTKQYPNVTKGGSGNYEALTTSFATLGLIPVDLHALFLAIQQSALHPASLGAATAT